MIFKSFCTAFANAWYFFHAVWRYAVKSGSNGLKYKLLLPYEFSNRRNKTFSAIQSQLLSPLDLNLYMFGLKFYRDFLSWCVLVNYSDDGRRIGTRRQLNVALPALESHNSSSVSVLIVSLVSTVKAVFCYMILM